MLKGMTRHLWFCWIWGGDFGGFAGLENGYSNDTILTNIAAEHPDYSADFQLAVVLSGNTLDTFFIQENEIPAIFFIPRNNIISSIEYAPIITPLEVLLELTAFSTWHARRMFELGNNNIWKDVVFSNPIANQRLVYPPDTTLGPIEGLFGISGVPENQQPWAYWDTEACEAIDMNIAANDLQQFPGANVEAGRSILDTMIQFFAPRACLALDLGCQGIIGTVQTHSESIFETAFEMMPNPSSGAITFRSSADHPMKLLQLYTSTGQLILDLPMQQASQRTLHLEIPNGIYWVKVHFLSGVESHKLIIQR